MKRLLLVVLLAACQAQSPPPQPPPQGWNQQPPPPGWGYPPPQGWGPPPPAQTWQPQQPPPPPTPQPQHVMLPPLVGAAMMQAEVRSILAELITRLPPQYASKVTGIPLVFESTSEVNAYAGCDEQGASYMGGTAGILDAIDGIAQTTATDELFGTKTYDAYMGAVAPKMLSKNPESPALPPGIVPAQLALDPRRLSRAREIFDDVAAFTWGHELAHHYLGHTGCANGDRRAPATLEEIAKVIARRASVVPLFNQPNELASDNWGIINVLETGKARPPTSYRLTERGGLLLLDFFSRIEAAAGANNLLVAFLASHPNSRFRYGAVQQAAQAWRAQQPR